VLVSTEHRRGPAHGYANGMKTAISLPDDVYHEAERHAKRTRKSRSQLYAEALAEYLARHAPDEVTERMNQVLVELGEPRLDPFLAGAARRLLKDVEW
jgi:succinate dehydrogenase/fumarate reductase flavoprotein subunit